MKKKKYVSLTLLRSFDYLIMLHIPHTLLFFANTKSFGIQKNVITRPSTIVVMTPETAIPSFVAPLVGQADAEPDAGAETRVQVEVTLLWTVTLADRERSAIHEKALKSHEMLEARRAP